MSQAKQLKFEDLQPHVDMLCDALENKGASSSGIPHDRKVIQNAHTYREILRRVRDNEITVENLLFDLAYLNNHTREAAEDNQYHRIAKIVEALDIFILKEYNKVTNEISNKKVGQA
jgi:hypothetical protein